MSSLFLFSSSSGIPLIFFTSLSNSESMGYSFVGTLNGTFAYSNFKSNILLKSCGNHLIDAHWSTFHGLNLVHINNRRTSIPISDYLIKIFESIFTLFSPDLFCYLPNTHGDIFSKELRKYSFSLQYILSKSQYFLNNDGLYLENTREGFEDFFEWRELSDKLNTSYIFCISEGKIISYSDLWFKLSHTEKFSIIALITSHLPHSFIDIPIYLQSFLPEPLRLISISFTASFQFIGLFASASKLDHITNILSIYKSSILERLISNARPFSNCHLIELSAVICYVFINYSTRTYFIEYSPRTNLTLTCLLRVMSEAFSEFVSAESSIAKFHTVNSEFCFPLKIQEFFLSYENISIYFLKKRNAIVAVASNNKPANYLKKMSEYLFDRMISFSNNSY